VRYALRAAALRSAQLLFALCWLLPKSELKSERLAAAKAKAQRALLVLTAFRIHTLQTLKVEGPNTDSSEP
jgi:hypothetical protein